MKGSREGGAARGRGLRASIFCQCWRLEGHLRMIVVVLVVLGNVVRTIFGTPTCAIRTLVVGTRRRTARTAGAVLVVAVGLGLLLLPVAPVTDPSNMSLRDIFSRPVMGEALEIRMPLACLKCVMKRLNNLISSRMIEYAPHRRSRQSSAWAAGSSARCNRS